jgi:hypothetical protein
MALDAHRLILRAEHQHALLGRGDFMARAARAVLESGLAPGGTPASLDLAAALGLRLEHTAANSYPALAALPAGTPILLSVESPGSCCRLVCDQVVRGESGVSLLRNEAFGTACFADVFLLLWSAGGSTPGVVMAAVSGLAGSGDAEALDRAVRALPPDLLESAASVAVPHALPPPVSVCCVAGTTWLPLRGPCLLALWGGASRGFRSVVAMPEEPGAHPFRVGAARLTLTGCCLTSVRGQPQVAYVYVEASE